MHRRIPLSLRIVAAIAVIAGFTAPASATTAAPDGATITQWSEARHAFGLPSDRATIIALLADPSSTYSRAFPTTTAEAADLTNREALERAAEPLVAFVERNDNIFGGAYFDHRPDGMVLVVLTTPEAGESGRLAVSQLVPQGLRTEYTAVPRALRALRDAQAQLRAAYDSLGIVETYPDLKSNSLHVVVSSQAAAQSIPALVSVPVTVEVGPPLQVASCPPRSNCTPYRGGIAIYTQYAQCTWGFNARVTGGQHQVVTAGHCGKTGISATHNSVVVTTQINANSYELLGSAYSDSMSGPASTAPGWASPYNTIYVSSTETARSITALQPYVVQAVGNTVCFSGYTNGWRCGTIEQKDIDAVLTRDLVDNKTQHVYQMLRMTSPTGGGDSGGPVFYGQTAYGVVTAADVAHSYKMVYSNIEGVQHDLGLNLCTNASC